MHETLTRPSLVMELYASINERDYKRLRDLFSDAISIDFPGAAQVTGKAQAVLFFRFLLARFQCLVFTVTDVATLNDKIFVVWENSGERLGGDRYKNRGITYITLSDGKIVLLSDYFKDTSFLIEPRGVAVSRLR